MSDPAVLQRFHNPESGYKWHTRTLAKTEDGPPRHIKVIEHPGVYLLAAMKLNDTGVNSYLADHQISGFTPWGETNAFVNTRNDRGTDHELLTELSGRVCYMSYERPRPGGCKTFIQNLKEQGHGSVLEHPHYSILLTGVSRNLTLEGNRHRPFSISQLSGRFVDASEVGFVCDPDMLPGESEPPSIEFEGWAESCRRSFDAYERQYATNFERQRAAWELANRSDKRPLAPLVLDKASERKVVKKARERARDILPGCLETRLIYTVNARAIRFVFEKRCHADAAFEIRRVFNSVFRMLKAHDPVIMSDYTEVPLPDGTFAVETAFGKI